MVEKPLASSAVHTTSFCRYNFEILYYQWLMITECVTFGNFS